MSLLHLLSTNNLDMKRVYTYISDYSYGTVKTADLAIFTANGLT